MFDSLSKLFDNQLFQGGVYLTILSSVLYYLKDNILRFFRSLFKRLFISLTVEEYSELYSKLIVFMNNQNSIVKLKHYTLFTRGKVLKIAPELGKQVFIKNRKLIAVDITKQERQNSSLKEMEGGHFINDVHRITINILFGSYKDLVNLIAEVNTLKNVENVVDIYYSRYGAFALYDSKPTRKRETLLFQDNLLEDLEKDLFNFINAASWYIQKNIPYKRGYLLYGPPGNGKSSLLQYLAGKFKKDIILITTETLLSGDYLRLDFNSMNFLIVIEEIDKVFQAKTSSTKQNEDFIKNVEESPYDDTEINMANIRQWLDGSLSKHGNIIFATTNHIERIDPVLLRSGRFDRKIYIGNTTKNEVPNLFSAYYETDYFKSDSFTNKLTFYKKDILSKSDIQEFYIENRFLEKEKVITEFKKFYNRKEKEGL